MLTIGIDFDETLVSSLSDGKIIDTYNQKFGKNISENDLKDYYFSDHDGFEEVYWEYYNDNFDNFPFYENSRETLLEWKKQNYLLYIITSRDISEKERTIAYLEKIFGKHFFQDIIFSKEMHDDNKATIAKNLGCDIVIDDAGHHIDRYKNETEMQIIQFQKGWNCDCEEHLRVKVVKNWREIAEYVDNFCKK